MRRPAAVSFPVALSVQLLRGALGFSALVTAYWVLNAHLAAAGLIAIGLVALALFALRGCPTCWLIGLVGLFSSRPASCPAPRSHRRR
jgi:hypothetical protein